MLCYLKLYYIIYIYAMGQNIHQIVHRLKESTWVTKPSDPWYHLPSSSVIKHGKLWDQARGTDEEIQQIDGVGR